MDRNDLAAVFDLGPRGEPRDASRALVQIGLGVGLLGMGLLAAWLMWYFGRVSAKGILAVVIAPAAGLLHVLVGLARLLATAVRFRMYKSLIATLAALAVVSAHGSTFREWGGRIVGSARPTEARRPGPPGGDMPTDGPLPGPGLPNVAVKPRASAPGIKATRVRRIPIRLVFADPPDRCTIGPSLRGRLFGNSWWPVPSGKTSEG